MVHHHLSPPFENISLKQLFFQASWPSFKSPIFFAEHGAADQQKIQVSIALRKKQPHEVARDVETPVVDIDEDRMTRTIGGGGGNESNEKVDLLW